MKGADMKRSDQFEAVFLFGVITGALVTVIVIALTGGFVR
jgi:hypothetical protein